MRKMTWRKRRFLFGLGIGDSDNSKLNFLKFVFLSLGTSPNTKGNIENGSQNSRPTFLTTEKK